MIDLLPIVNAADKGAAAQANFDTIETAINALQEPETLTLYNGDFTATLSVDVDHGEDGALALNRPFNTLDVLDTLTIGDPTLETAALSYGYHEIADWYALETDRHIRTTARVMAQGDGGLMACYNDEDTAWVRIRCMDDGGIVPLFQVKGASDVYVETDDANPAFFDFRSGGGIKNTGVQVLGARITGWTGPTGTATRSGFATGSVTLEALAEAVKALIDDLTTHGVIGY